MRFSGLIINIRLQQELSTSLVSLQKHAFEPKFFVKEFSRLIWRFQRFQSWPKHPAVQDLNIKLLDL